MDLSIAKRVPAIRGANKSVTAIPTPAIREILHAGGREAFLDSGNAIPGSGNSGGGRQEEKQKGRWKSIGPLHELAEWTGLEPATPGVTGRYSNQLNYHSSKPWRPHGDSNPGYRRERAVS